MTNTANLSLSGTTSTPNLSLPVMCSRHATTTLKQDAFYIRYATLKAAPGTIVHEPIDVDPPEPTSNSTVPMDQEIQSR